MANFAPLLSVVVLGSIILQIAPAVGLDGHQAKCLITEGNGVKVDSCDASKFLSCQAGRCMCNDLGNQLFDYRLEPLDQKSNSRTKRGTKKKIAAGIVGGAAVGYIATKTLSPKSGSKNDKHKLAKVYSCYGRVGSPCVMDYNNVNIVTLGTTTTTTSTTTPIPEVGNATISVSTTTTVSSSSSSSQVVDLTKIPKCVRNAFCTRPNKPSGSVTGHVVKSDGDPRIGVCMCLEGYKASNTDKCEKSDGVKVSFGITSVLSLILYFVIGNKIVV